MVDQLFILYTLVCHIILLRICSLQDYIELLMPSLIQKWNTLKDDDKDLFPLLEVYMLVHDPPWTLLHVLLMMISLPPPSPPPPPPHSA